MAGVQLQQLHSSFYRDKKRLIFNESHIHIPFLILYNIAYTTDFYSLLLLMNSTVAPKQQQHVPLTNGLKGKNFVPSKTA
jgi:hypothetical protein